MRRNKIHRIKSADKPLDWFPVDTRLFPFFSFSHVRGAARLFLIIEMSLSVLVVIGTVGLVVLTLI